MTMSLKILMTSAAMFLVLGLSACDKKESSAQKLGETIDDAAAKTVDNIVDATKKADSSVDDSAITVKVKAAILAEPELYVLDISVNTKENVTTLSGSVDSSQAKIRAEEVASAVQGVKSVDNLLTITSVK